MREFLLYILLFWSFCHLFIAFRITFSKDWLHLKNKIDKESNFISLTIIWFIIFLISPIITVLEIYYFVIEITLPIRFKRGVKRAIKNARRNIKIDEMKRFNESRERLLKKDDRGEYDAK